MPYIKSGAKEVWFLKRVVLLKRNKVFFRDKNKEALKTSQKSVRSQSQQGQGDGSFILSSEKRVPGPCS